ncbi:WXG100 family type VII secretion target [Microbacterium gilvum]|uniref:ESAT-6-like protein n=1 Tax=Microbacterium gilvum TaxID=1336204 RepID=A0ABP9AJ21_9MICO
MPAYVVDSDALMTQAANIDSTRARIQSDTDAMSGQLAQLEAVWQGSASAGFQSVLLQWRAAQQNMHDALASIGQALGLAGGQYAEAEQFSVGMFR